MKLSIFALLVGIGAGVQSLWAQQAPLAESFLIEGRLVDAEAALSARLKAEPGDDQAGYGLGVTQFLRGVERLSQSLYRYGALSGRWTENLPLLRVAPHITGTNPNPEQITYADVRSILQTWIDDLSQAQATLAQIKDPNVKLPLHIGMIRLDFNGDGKAGEDEYLWRLYQMFNRLARVDQAQAQNFVIGFDAADVLWLRGYCHLLMSMSEIILAYDQQAQFDTTAQLLFARPVTPHPWVSERVKLYGLDADLDAADAIAFIHLIHFDLKEPQRMPESLKHLQEMVRLSREYWAVAGAETDDDHEWIPNPGQTGVIPNWKITPQMVQAWQEFLNESDDLLAGRKLIPFWRSNTGLGVNLNKAFTQPRQLDLVLWVQGSAATPYLERGELTRPDSWGRWMRIFEGQFIGFAIWIN